MKIKDNNENYILFEAETNEERIDFVDVFNAHDITLWVSTEGRVDGIKLWKKSSYKEKIIKK